ncbi:MAG: PTS cellobiose transporter subunit IIC [Vulcanimicrobiaceae bacterium]
MSSHESHVDERPSLGGALLAAIRALSVSPEMVAIQRTLPVSFVGLAIGLVAFMALQPSGSLLMRFSHAFGAAFGVMSVVLVVALAYDLAPRRAVPRPLGLVVASAAFALALPYQRATSFVAVAKALGSSGLFLAIGIALVSIASLAFARRRLGSRTGSFVGAAVVLGVAAALLARGVSLTAGLTALIAPLGHLGDSLAALLIITLVETLLWTIGIHGPALLAAVVLPVYIDLQVQNTEALAHGDPLPHIVTVSMFLFVFPGGAGATFPLVLLLLRSRIKRIRRIALATLLPSVANANEPLMFGLPLVLNPMLGVPFVVTPLVLAVVSYEAMWFGLVARPAYYIPSTVPLPLGAFLATKDWRSVLLMIVNIAIGLAIYAPFVAAYERHEGERLVEEGEAA